MIIMLLLQLEDVGAELAFAETIPRNSMKFTSTVLACNAVLVYEGGGGDKLRASVANDHYGVLCDV